MEKMRVLCNPENPCATGDRTQWGGGALSSNVSKLVSKEVSKILRNFSLAIKKACHCEDERSEDVAIAKSLNINEITTQSTIARNDHTRHPELVSGSQMQESGESQIAQQVRDDKLHHRNFSLAPWGEGVRRTGEGSRAEGKCAFTLAEVLITIGVIGIVAAITMPTLVAKIQDHVKAKRIENIRQKLSKVTDAMSATSGINGYPNTMEFVKEMNKHMKIAKICDNDNLSACWPTKEVMLNDEGKMWEIAKTKNPKTLRIPKAVLNNYTNTVGIVTADGTSMILSYDKTCDFNPEVTGYAYSGGLSNSASCLAGVFDWNGGKNPNKLGKDVITMGVASGLGNDCAFELNGKCFTAPLSPTPLTRAECESRKGELNINACSNLEDPDYWAGAAAICGGTDKMITMAELGQLAGLVYKEHPTVGVNQLKRGLTLDTSVATAMGFPGSHFFVWSGEEYDRYWVYYRGFFSSYTNTYRGTRSNSHGQAVCVAD